MTMITRRTWRPRSQSRFGIVFYRHEIESIQPLYVPFLVGSIVFLLQAQEREEPALETEAAGAGESGAEGRRGGRRPRRTSGRLRQGPGALPTYHDSML